VLGLDVWNGSQAQLTSFGNRTGVTFPLLLRAATGTNFGVSSSGAIDVMMVVDQEGIVRRRSPANPTAVSAAVSLVRELLTPSVPVIGTIPTSLNFGPELQPGESKTLSVEVQNTGTDTLNLTSIQSDIPELTVSDSTFSILPDESREIQVTLTPTQDGTLSGILSFLSNDPQQGTLRIVIESITVKTLPSEIALAAEQLEFNNIEVGSRVNRTLTIRNEGQGSLKITDVKSDLPGLSVSQKAFEVPPGESHDLTVTVTPTAEGAFSGSLTIVSNDPDQGMIVLTLSGSAVMFQPEGRADFNGSGRIDFADFVIFAQGFGRQAGQAGFDERLDLNDNGRIDFPDFVIFARSFGSTVN
jgi:hypothetical protein